MMEGSGRQNRAQKYTFSLYFSLLTGIHAETGFATDCIHRHSVCSSENCSLIRCESPLSGPFLAVPKSKWVPEQHGYLRFGAFSLVGKSAVHFSTPKVPLNRKVREQFSLREHEEWVGPVMRCSNRGSAVEYLHTSVISRGFMASAGAAHSIGSIVKVRGRDWVVTGPMRRRGVHWPTYHCQFA
jgi:hypothetical protein